MGSRLVCNQRPIRCVVLALLLMALLAIATTAVNVWHHHTDNTESTCPICHLSHQPMERSVPADRAPALALLGAQPEPREPELAPAPATPRKPARAPPLA